MKERKQIATGELLRIFWYCGMMKFEPQWAFVMFIFTIDAQKTAVL